MIERWFIGIAYVCGTLPVVVATAVMLGWCFRLDWLSGVATGVAMRANTASCFIACGVATLLSINGSGRSIRETGAIVLGLTASVVGLMTICEYVFKVDLRIDQLIIRDHQPASHNFFPGRMSPMTATAFATLGLSIALVDFRSSKRLIPSQILALVTFGIASLAAVGYIYHAHGLFDIPVFTQMAFHTSMCFISASIAVLAARPRQGLMQLLSSNMIGSTFVRRLLLIAIGVPILLGWLSLQLRAANAVSEKSGLALLIVINVSLLVLVILVTGYFLNQADAKRTIVENNIRQRVAQEQLLVNEVNHRVRNNLSSIVALVAMSKLQHQDVDSFASTIQARVSSMATVHNMLAASRWQPVDLKEMIEAVTVRHADKFKMSVAEPVRIPARQASAMIMVVNELYTNSFKHGALSKERGFVAVSWNCDQSVEASRGLLRMTWREHGGPLIHQLPKQGTGMKLVQGLLKHELHGDVCSHYESSGVSHEITIELDRLCEKSTDDLRQAPV